MIKLVNLVETVSVSNDEAEQIAKLFHDTYEKLAPAFGYKTREDSRTEWSNVPENNKKLMIKTAQVVFNTYLNKKK